jgi:hypothetical protein
VGETEQAVVSAEGACLTEVSKPAGGRVWAVLLPKICEGAAVGINRLDDGFLQVLAGRGVGHLVHQDAEDEPLVVFASGQIESTVQGYAATAAV